jgi:hypothetical protein
MIEEKSSMKIFRHLEPKYPQFTPLTIIGYVLFFQEYKWDMENIVSNLAKMNNWTKESKYYYWTKKGAKRLFYDAKKYKEEKGLQ